MSALLQTKSNARSIGSLRMRVNCACEMTSTAARCRTDGLDPQGARFAGRVPFDFGPTSLLLPADSPIQSP